MMHVMIRDNLVDHDYIARHTVGYEALVERVRQHSPEAVRIASVSRPKKSSASLVPTPRHIPHCYDH